MPAKSKGKDSAMAKMLKERGVERSSGACPWGCGRMVTNGGSALLIHLNTCKGRSKGVRP